MLVRVLLFVSLAAIPYLSFLYSTRFSRDESSWRYSIAGTLGYSALSAVFIASIELPWRPLMARPSVSPVLTGTGIGVCYFVFEIKRTGSRLAQGFSKDRWQSVVAYVTVALAEEIAYRLLPLLVGRSTPISLAASVFTATLLYGTSHIAFGIPTTLSRVAFGAVLIGTTLVSGTIWAAITGHSLYNGAVALRSTTERRTIWQ